MIKSITKVLLKIVFIAMCFYCMRVENRHQEIGRDREIDADQIQTCILVIAYTTHCATALTYNKILMYNGMCWKSHRHTRSSILRLQSLKFAVIHVFKDQSSLTIHVWMHRFMERVEPYLFTAQVGSFPSEAGSCSRPVPLKDEACQDALANRNAIM